MTVSVSFLSIMVVAALALCTITPIVLIGLLIRDARRGKLW